MLRLSRATGRIEDLCFRDFPELLLPGDLVVFNNTRVFPARLYGRRSGSKAQTLSAQNPASRDFLKGRIEVLLTKQVCAEPNEWECLVRPGRKIGVGEQLYFGEQDELVAEVVARAGFGERRVRFDSVPDFWAMLDRLGHVPLPPYIAREDRSSDRDRYQTVYVLARLKERGIETAEITLQVGLGTFQPVRTEQVEEHKLHGEAYEIPPEATVKINQALEEKRRVVAIGTTTVRTLEYGAMDSGRVQPGSGEAQLFIYPGFQFRVVSVLLTNFHLPQSTLLMLVSAFGETEHVITAYRHAVEQRYRFYSYGDCMLVE
jgi:S-adenosylmethionine:tRNA ribosyltransferase-isomerase